MFQDKRLGAIWGELLCSFRWACSQGRFERNAFFLEGVLSSNQCVESTHTHVFRTGPTNVLDWNLKMYKTKARFGRTNDSLKASGAVRYSLSHVHGPKVFFCPMGRQTGIHCSVCLAGGMLHDEGWRSVFGGVDPTKIRRAEGSRRARSRGATRICL